VCFELFVPNLAAALPLPAASGNDGSMNTTERYEDIVTLPRAVRFPVELIPPDGFDEERLETWPQVAGRLECFNGRLLYMPPCGDLQQFTVTDVVITLGAWVRAHPEFLLGTNEAGMRLRGSTRAADAAIWRRADIGEPRGGVHRVPPVLAIEVTGDDESEPDLRAKAVWYRDSGVDVVWIIVPDSRQVLVIDQTGEHRLGSGETLPQHPSLPDLTARVDDFFVQIATRP
jgi:Uma2 family endonuclease